MSASVLIDTNVLVYAEDSREPGKRELAQRAITELARAGDAVLTAQVLAEYVVTVTRKFDPPLTSDEAAAHVERLTALFPVLDVGLPVVREALRGSARYGMHHWDAQVWASARLAGIGTVLSEDFARGTEIEGVRFADPFAAEGS